MYGNTPDRWSDSLRGDDRLRCIVNGLTRLRYLHADGRMDFKCTEAPADAPEGLIPWFQAPNRRSAGRPIIFGHWSSLGLKLQPDLIALAPAASGAQPHRHPPGKPPDLPAALPGPQARREGLRRATKPLPAPPCGSHRRCRTTDCPLRPAATDAFWPKPLAPPKAKNMISPWPILCNTLHPGDATWQPSIPISFAPPAPQPH